MRSRTAFLAVLLFGLAMLLGLRMLVRLATGTPGQGTSRAPEAPLLPPVRVESSRFTVDGEPFRFIGANAIYFGLYPEYGFSVTETIKAARENGITVLRIYLWLGGGPWGGQTLEDYDAVLDAAAREGVYILAVLTDCCPGSDWAPTPEEYFRNVPHCNLTDPSGLTAFKEHIESILTRRNTVNGRIYRDDPTILGWDVANEPQLQHFEHEEVHRWLGEVVAHIKALDKNHLVTIGIVDSPAYDQPGPAYAALDVPGLDFHSYHYYTSGDWCASDAYVQAIRLRAETWAATGKPVVLEEFGFGSQRELEARLGHEAEGAELACWLGAYEKAMDAAFAAGASGVMFWGWGDPETRTVPLWWHLEDHDVTEVEFCSLMREYARAVSDGGE